MSKTGIDPYKTKSRSLSANFNMFHHTASTFDLLPVLIQVHGITPNFTLTVTRLKVTLMCYYCLQAPCYCVSLYDKPSSSNGSVWISALIDTKWH